MGGRGRIGACRRPRGRRPADLPIWLAVDLLHEFADRSRGNLAGSGKRAPCGGTSSDLSVRWPIDIPPARSVLALRSLNFQHRGGFSLGWFSLSPVTLVLPRFLLSLVAFIITEQRYHDLMLLKGHPAGGLGWDTARNLGKDHESFIESACAAFAHFPSRYTRTSTRFMMATSPSASSSSAARSIAVPNPVQRQAEW